MVRLKHVLAILALAMLPQIADAQQITNYPSASTPLSGSEIIYLIQNGISMQTTVGSLLPATTAGLFAAPPPIGFTTPNSGAFSTLSTTGTATFGGATAISDATIPAQISAALNTQAYFAANKSGAYGLRRGSNDNSGFLGGAGGLIRMVTSDPLRFVMNNSVQAASFDSSGNFLELNTLRGGHLSGRADIAGGTTWSSGTAGEGVSNLYVSGSASGSVASSGVGGINYLAISSDSLACATASGGFCSGFELAHNFGGAAMTGSRNGFNAVMNLTATSGNTTGVGGSYVAGQFTMQSAVNDNGTALTQAGARGLVYGVNPVAHLFSGATFYTQATADESDCAVDNGASALDFVCMQIVTLVSHHTAGARDDVMLSMNSQGGAGVTYGLEFGRYGGFFPLSTTGTMIYGQGNAGTGFTVANGIDWHLGTATGNWMNLGGVFTVTGAGDVLANSATTLGTSATAGFLHLPHTAATPTGTPTNTTPGCEWNTASHTMNCYDGASWYHFTGTSGAS